MNYIQMATTKTTFERWATASSYSQNEEGQVMTLNLRGAGLTTFRATKELQHLKRLDLSKNRLTKVVFEAAMPDLEFLDISYNQVQLDLVDIQQRCPKLKYLYIYESKLEVIRIAFPLPQLCDLNLGKNQLKSVVHFKGYHQLVSLSLRNNELTAFNVPLRHLPALEYLNLGDNPIKNTIVQGFAADTENCLAAIRENQGHESEGVALDNECKVLLVGNGNVGKSCFVERLVNNNFKRDWVSTHAITIAQYKIENRKGLEYVLNLWDFGGQDMYHATHRLFMQSNAVYLLFWDWKTERDETTECKEYEDFYNGTTVKTMGKAVSYPNEIK